MEFLCISHDPGAAGALSDHGSPRQVCSLPSLRSRLKKEDPSKLYEYMEFLDKVNRISQLNKEEKRAVAKVLAPVDPKAIVCIGLNYAKHAAESGMAVPDNPVVFHKTVSTLNHPVPPPHPQPPTWPAAEPCCGLCGQGDFIDLPKIESKPDWEVELAIVIVRAPPAALPHDVHVVKLSPPVGSW